MAETVVVRSLRELDALVAEKVMGYMWEYSSAGKCRFLAPVADARTPIAEKDVIPCRDADRFVPAYSTDWSAFGELWEDAVRKELDPKLGIEEGIHWARVTAAEGILLRCGYAADPRVAFAIARLEGVGVSVTLELEVERRG